MVSLVKLSGFASEFLNANDNTYPTFFKPYQSTSDFFYRSASVIAAPIIYTGSMAYFAFSAGVELFAALHETFFSSNENSKHWSFCGEEASRSVCAFFFAAISPFLNLAYLVCGAVAAVCFETMPKNERTEMKDESCGYERDCMAS